MLLLKQRHQIKRKAVSKAKIEQAIIIKGGANVTDPKTLNRNVKYKETEVTAAELEILKANPGFMRRVDRGFISIGKVPTDIKKDKSAQITEKEMKAKTKAKTTTGPVEE